MSVDKSNKFSIIRNLVEDPDHGTICILCSRQSLACILEVSIVYSGRYEWVLFLLKREE